MPGRYVLTLINFKFAAIDDLLLWFILLILKIRSGLTAYVK